MTEKKENPKNEEVQALTTIPIQVTYKNNLPCIQLRKYITDIEMVKSVISCTFHNRPIIIMPKFTDTYRSIASLIDKGILYKKGDNYYFTF